MPTTLSFRSRTFGSSICWRLNASSCLVRSAARWPAVLISSMSRAKRFVRPEAAADHLGVAQDHREDVVEVVRDAAGETADGLHLLRVAQLLFGVLERRFGALSLAELSHRRLQKASVGDRQCGMIGEGLREVAIRVAERRRGRCEANQREQPDRFAPHPQCNEEKAVNPDGLIGVHDVGGGRRPQLFEFEPWNEQGFPRLEHPSCRALLGHVVGRRHVCVNPCQRVCVADVGLEWEMRRNGREPPRGREETDHTAVLDDLCQTSCDHIQQMLVIGRGFGERAQRAGKDLEPILEPTDSIGGELGVHG